MSDAVGRLWGTDFVVDGVDGAVERILALGGGWVAFANVHMVVEAHRDRAFHRELGSASMVCPDGRPVALLLRLLGHRRARQLAGPALTEALLERAAADGIPVALYGGAPGTVARLREVLAERLPALDIAAAITPPFRELGAEEEAAHRAELDASGARLCFVALGCPKQELWCARNAPRMQATCLAVGAAFPMLAGQVPRAPALLRRLYLEWCYRLLREPKRLWRRYLETNPAFLNLALRELWRR